MITKSLFRIRRIVLCVMLCCAALLVGCSNKSAMERVEYVLQSAEQEPEAALECISSINPNQIRGARDRARYALAYSEAMYYNHIDSDCDTLVTPMMRYYIHEDKHHAERARALYQYASVMHNMDKPTEAMYALLESEASIDVEDDLKLRALIYRLMGSLYGGECLYKNALESFYKALDAIELTELDFHRAFIQYEIGEVLCLTKHYDQAEEILNSVKTISIEKGYWDLLSLTLHTLSDVYIATNRMADCGAIIQYFETYQCPLLFELNYYYICAIYYSSIGNEDEAFKNISIADSYPNDANVSPELLKYYVYSNLQYCDQALEWLSCYTEQQEEVMLDILELPLLNTQVQLLAKDVEIAEHRAKNTRLYTTIIITMVILVVLLLFIHVRGKIKRQQHDIEEYMSIIDELRTNSNIVRGSLSKDVNKLFGRPFSDINNLCEMYYADSSVSWKTSHIISSVRGIVDSITNNETNIQKLEGIVNLHCDNIIAKLKINYPKLNNKEIKFIIYSLSGFSSRSICLLLDIDAAAISRLKYKIKEKIGNEEFSIFQGYINMCMEGDL